MTESIVGGRVDVLLLQQQLAAQEETISDMKHRLAIYDAQRLAGSQSGGAADFQLQDLAVQAYVGLCNDQINGLKNKYKQKYADTLLKCQEHDMRCQESVQKSKSQLVLLEDHATQLQGQIARQQAQIAQLEAQARTAAATERALTQQVEELRQQILYLSEPVTGRNVEQREYPGEKYRSLSQEEAAEAEIYHRQQLEYARAAASDGLQDGVHIPVQSVPEGHVNSNELLDFIERDPDDCGLDSDGRPLQTNQNVFPNQRNAAQSQQNTSQPSQQFQQPQQLRQQADALPVSPLPPQAPARSVSPSRLARPPNELQVLLKLHPQLAQNKLFADVLRVEIAARHDVMFGVKEDGKIELFYLQGQIAVPNLTIQQVNGGFSVHLARGQSAYIACFAQFTSGQFVAVDLSDLGLRHIFIIIPKLRESANLSKNSLEVAICEGCPRLAEVLVSRSQEGAVFAAKKTQLRQV